MTRSEVINRMRENLEYMIVNTGTFVSKVEILKLYNDLIMSIAKLNIEADHVRKSKIKDRELIP